MPAINLSINPSIRRQPPQPPPPPPAPTGSDLLSQLILRQMQAPGQVGGMREVVAPPPPRPAVSGPVENVGMAALARMLAASEAGRRGEPAPSLRGGLSATEQNVFQASIPGGGGGQGGAGTQAGTQRAPGPQPPGSQQPGSGTQGGTTAGGTGAVPGTQAPAAQAQAQAAQPQLIVHRDRDSGLESKPFSLESANRLAQQHFGRDWHQLQYWEQNSLVFGEPFPGRRGGAREAFGAEPGRVVPEETAQQIQAAQQAQEVASALASLGQTLSPFGTPVGIEPRINPALRERGRLQFAPEIFAAIPENLRPLLIEIMERLGFTASGPFSTFGPSEFLAPPSLDEPGELLQPGVLEGMLSDPVALAVFRYLFGRLGLGQPVPFPAEAFA